MLALTAFHLAALLAAAILLIAGAISDARHYRIPNLVCLALVLLFPVFVATAPSSVDWKQHLMVALLVLAAGFGMFMARLTGAGDIKFLVAGSLWSGPHLIAVFLVVTAIAGGLLAIAIGGSTYMRHRAGDPAAALAQTPIPYGIAIGLGGLSALYMIAQPILLPG